MIINGLHDGESGGRLKIETDKIISVLEAYEALPTHSEQTIDVAEISKDELLEYQQILNSEGWIDCETSTFIDGSKHIRPVRLTVAGQEKLNELRSNKKWGLKVLSFLMRVPGAAAAKKLFDACLDSFLGKFPLK